ncbi:MAG: hypothetical protein ACRDSL_01520 [Pseudonocardiaceae bacterium]
MTTTTSPAAARSAPRTRPGTSAWAKHVLVFLHVLTSLGWWAMGLAQLSFIAVALGTTGAGRLAALEAAQHLDHTLLIYFANAAAYTGIMLAALTPWGFFRYWWVAVKFALTVVLTIVGIALLGQWRQGMIDATRSGTPSPDPLLVVGGVAATVGALVFLTWVSVAKPWGRLRTGTRRSPQPPARTFLLACAPPLVDYAVSLALGFPSPLLQLLTVLIYPAWRARPGGPSEPAPGHRRRAALPAQR